MLVNACNIDLTFYCQLSLTSIDIIFGANEIKSILKKKGGKKGRNKSTTKTCQQKTSLETYYIEIHTGICSMA